MKKRMKDALLCSGAALVGAAGLVTAYRLTTRYLVRLALDREEPKSAAKDRERMMSSDELTRALATAADAAAALEGSVSEAVTIESRDGTPLAGHWFCPAAPRRVIVAMHGWRSSWSQDFGVIAPFWHGSDCAVLYAEQRGQGGSGGDYMGFGLLERFDCLDWIGWVNERTGGRLPVYLGGISMGAATVLMAGGLELPDNVRGIMADCGFTSPRAIWKHVVEDNLHLPYGIYSPAIEELCKRRIRISTDYSTVEALENCTVPVLFIHGTDDHFVPVEMTYENYKACRSPKRLLIVPGAEHGMSYLVDREGYEAAVKAFWAQYDGGPAGTTGASPLDPTAF